MNNRLNHVFLRSFLFLSLITKITMLSVCNIEPLICCPNYRRIANRCEACWPGSYGVNCKLSCPDGFYGNLCAEICNCSSCNKISGCTHNSSSLEYGHPIADDIEWRSIVMSVSSAGLCFVIGYILHCKLRKRRYAKRSNSRGNDEIQLEVPNSNGPQINPCASSTVSSECPENLTISKEPHISSKCHNQTGVLSDRCLPENVAFKDCNISEDADDISNTSENVYSHLNMDTLPYIKLHETSESKNADNISNTSENVYSHLNMDALPYNTLHDTSESKNEPNVGMYSKSSQSVTITDSNFYNKSMTACRRSFLYLEDALPREEEYSQTNKVIEKSQKDISTLDKVSEKAKSILQKSEDLTSSLTRQNQIPSKRERLAKKMHMNEMSKMLENFKPKTEEVENIDSKANIIYRQWSSKKRKKKLLRYSFAPSTEIA